MATAIPPIRGVCIGFFGTARAVYAEFLGWVFLVIPEAYLPKLGSLFAYRLTFRANKSMPVGSAAIWIVLCTWFERKRAL